MNQVPDIAPYEALRAESELLRTQLVAAKTEARSSLEKLARLEHELAQFKRLIFGARSERFEASGSPDQLGLFGTAAPPEAPLPSTVPSHKRRPRRKPARQALPSHLPREIITIEPATDTRRLRKIGEEVTETLDYRPAKLVVIRRVRPKYVDPKAEDGGIVIGTLPPRPVDKGMAEPGLLAQVTIEKYVDHLPLYRQVQRFRREGITLSESTLGGWIRATADLLVPLYEALKAEALQSGYIQAERRWNIA